LSECYIRSKNENPPTHFSAERDWYS